VIVPEGIRYVSVLPGTGYGDSAAQYIAGLRALGIPVSWAPTSGGDGELSQDAIHSGIRRAPIPYDTVLLHDQPQNFGRWIERDRVNIGYVAWESDRAPRRWRESLELLELVLVPSAFCQRAVIETGTSTRVEVLPHIARPVQPMPGGRFDPISEQDFVFYTIGPWHNRKALPETICAFADTFTSADDVALIIKTSAFDYTAMTPSPGRPKKGRQNAVMSWWSLATLLAGYPNHPKVFLHCADASPDVIDQIHTRGDCFVSLTRGEGWGLGCFDAALFGNPSIITGWGGHLEYLGPDYPFLVDYELVPTSFDQSDAFGFPLEDDSHWARAERRQAGELMSQAYENREQTPALGAALRRRLVDKYASVVITSRLVGLIAETHDRCAPDRVGV
jgi:glycosyltransferase involved in cell wall biosynthesis